MLEGGPLQKYCEIGQSSSSTFCIGVGEYYLRAWVCTRTGWPGSNQGLRNRGAYLQGMSAIKIAFKVKLPTNGGP